MDNLNDKVPQYVIDRCEAYLQQQQLEKEEKEKEQYYKDHPMEDEFSEEDYIEAKHSFHTDDPNFNPYYDNPDDYNDIKPYSADIYYNGEGLWCVRVINNNTLEELFFNKEDFQNWCIDNNINYLNLEFPTEEKL